MSEVKFKKGLIKFGVVVAFFLFFFLIFFFIVRKQAVAQGPIYIDNCTVLDQEGATYYLTTNIVDISVGVCINVAVSNIILDCQGYLIDGTDASSSYGIYIVGVSNITVRNCVVSDFEYGFDIENSYYVTLINNTVNSNVFGIYSYQTTDSNFTNNTANSNTFGFLFFVNNNYNNFINNKVFSNMYGFRIEAWSNDNNFIDNIISMNTYGFYIYYSNYNNITGGSIDSSSNYDYYLSSGSTTNYFVNTNFTAARKIYFEDTASWFNYRNGSYVQMKNNVSTRSAITRTLLNWNQTNITWTEQADTTVTAQYNLTGLQPNTIYDVRNSSGTYQIQTDPSGNLNFLTQLTTTTQTISVYQSPNSQPVLSNIWEYPTDPATYSSGQIYIFNVTVCDADGATDISTVLFEWGGANVSVTSYITHNATCRNYTTTKIDLPAQSATTYKWYANDSANAWSNVLSDSYTINKAIPTFSISGSNVTYPTNVNVQFSESNSGDADLTYQWWRNSTNIVNGSSASDTTRLGAGNYYYKGNTTGGQNYTSAESSSYLITVSKGNPTTNMVVSSSAGWTITYPTSTQLSGSETNSGDTDLTYVLWKNDTQITNPTTETYGAGTYIIKFNTTGGANWTSGEVSNILTVNKGIPTLNLYLNNTTNNFTITWLEGLEIKGNESNIGDSDLSYCLYNSTSQIGCGSPFSIVYAGKSFSNTSSPYKFTFNTSGGQNYTANTISRWLFVNKGWNQTDRIEAGEEYEYDLNLKGVPVVVYMSGGICYDNAVEVDKTVDFAYNFTINNTNNNTGLQVGFTNVYVNFSKLYNTTLFLNKSVAEANYNILNFNEPEYFTLNLSGVLVKYKNFTKTLTIYTLVKKYDYKFYVDVVEDYITKTKNIIFYINYSVFDEWNAREKALTSYYVDGKTYNTTYEELDTQNRLRIIVGTNFSASSLEQGEHLFNIIYWVPYVTGGGGGGGGYYEQPQVGNVSIAVYPNPIEVVKLTPGNDTFSFRIKNFGSEPIFVKLVAIEGKDVIVEYEIVRGNTSEIVKINEDRYISLEPGEEVLVNVRYSVYLKSARIILVVKEKTAGDVERVVANVNVVGGLSIFEKLQKNMFYPIIGCAECNFEIREDGIYIPFQENITYPIGWLLFLITTTILTFIFSKIFKMKTKEKHKKEDDYVAFFISLGLTTIVWCLV